MDPIKNNGAMDYTMTMPQQNNVQPTPEEDYSSMPMVYDPTMDEKKESAKSGIALKALAAVGIAGLATFAANKLDSSEPSYSYSNSSKRDGFSVRFKRFARSTMYATVALILILAGLGMFYVALDNPFKIQVVPFYLALLTGLMLIWGGGLVFAIKGRNGYTFKNIIGSVFANVACKIAGLFAAFSNLEFLSSLNFFLRLCIGVCLFIAGHYVFKEIISFLNLSGDILTSFHFEES